MSLLDSLPVGDFAPDATALAVSLGSAILHVPFVRATPSDLRMITKITATSCLAAVAFLHGAPTLLVVALALCTLGDAFLVWDGDTNFLLGLASFLSAHLVYVVVFAQAGDGPSALLSGLDRTVPAGVMAVLVPSIAAALMPRVERGLRAPILVYSAAFFTMVLAALTVPNDRIAVGAVFFAVSDSLLAAEKFLVDATSAQRPWMQHTVWATYYVAQLLIATAW